MLKHSLSIAVFLSSVFSPHLFSTNLHDEQKEGSLTSLLTNTTVVEAGLNALYKGFEMGSAIARVYKQKEIGKNINHTLNDNKKEEFFKAIENNNIKKVKMFLDTYKDVVTAIRYKITPFLCAAREGQLAIAKLLKKRGAEINAKDFYGNNALHTACFFSDSEPMVTWLLDVCKIDLESKGEDKQTPFLFAVLNDRLEIAKLLKERGANINAKDWTGENALHRACRKPGSVEMVTWLLDVCKVDIESKNIFFQKTPFIYAAQKGQLAIAKLLKERSANIHAKDEYGSNALHYACCFSGSVEMITWLLDECKIDKESKGYNQRTSFLSAAAGGQVEIAKLLKERGANIYAKDKDGDNALRIASNKEMISYLESLQLR